MNGASFDKKEAKRNEQQRRRNERRQEEKRKERRERRGRTILYILYSKEVQTEGIIGAKKELLHFVRSSVHETFV